MTMWKPFAITAAAIFTACGPADDMEEMIRGALVQANIRQVDVATQDRTVRLSGTVDTLADRTRAVELASAIVGPSGRVENDITVAGLGPLDDDGRDEASAEGERQ